MLYLVCYSYPGPSSAFIFTAILVLSLKFYVQLGQPVVLPKGDHLMMILLFTELCSSRQAAEGQALVFKD